MAERCRYCSRPLDRREAAHRRFGPFCSERCRLAELGQWFGERYVISREVEQVADDAATTAKAPLELPPAEPETGPSNDINS